MYRVHHRSKLNSFVLTFCAIVLVSGCLLAIASSMTGCSGKFAYSQGGAEVGALSGEFDLATEAQRAIVATANFNRCLEAAQLDDKDKLDPQSCVDNLAAFAESHKQSDMVATITALIDKGVVPAEAAKLWRDELARLAIPPKDGGGTQ